MANPEPKAGEQPRIGDQSKAHREAFWNTGLVACYRCGGKQIQRHDNALGRRSNGEAYGAWVFMCTDCDWVTSFHYDESVCEGLDSGNPLHLTEPKSLKFERGIQNYTAEYLVLWAKKYVPEAVLAFTKKKLDATGLMDLKRRERLDELCVGKVACKKIDQAISDKLCLL